LPQVNHILHVIPTDPDDQLSDIRIPNAALKRLQSNGQRKPGHLLAIFRTSAQAQDALNKNDNPRYRLSLWQPTVYAQGNAADNVSERNAK
jgi:hypothetical protein